jgi:hypothetical protein
MVAATAIVGRFQHVVSTAVVFDDSVTARRAS